MRNSEKIFDGSPPNQTRLNKYTATKPATFKGDESIKFVPPPDEEIAVGKNILGQLTELLQTSSHESEKYFSAMQNASASLMSQLLLATYGQPVSSFQNLRARIRVIGKLSTEVMKIERPFSSETACATVAWIDRSRRVNGLPKVS